jgi:hypothetical protein
LDFVRFTPKADIAALTRNVRFVVKSGLLRGSKPHRLFDDLKPKDDGSIAGDGRASQQKTRFVE